MYIDAIYRKKTIVGIVSPTERERPTSGYQLQLPIRILIGDQINGIVSIQINLSFFLHNNGFLNLTNIHTYIYICNICMIT